MNNFAFQNPTKIYFGKNQLSHLKEEIKQFGNNVLLIYGGGSIKRSGLYDTIISVLKTAEVNVFELPGVEPNPRHSTVNRGADICKNEHIDVLLAVGGGSTIDCTKAIAAAAFYDGDCWDLVKQKSPVTKALPILTVLTLSATGSEMDCGGVISNMDTHEKLGLIHPLLFPKVSFLDPTNTFSVSAFQTACGSMDIISHVFDCNYFTADNRMDMACRIQEEIIRTVIKYAPIATKEPENYDARANLMWAATWALNGFLDSGISQAAVCHMMEHELSAFYDITHGLGLAILTPRWMEYILDEQTAPQLKRFGSCIFDVDDSLSDIEGAKEAVSRFSKFLYQDLNLQSHLSDLGIDDKHFAEMAQKACNGGVMKSIKDLTPKDVEAIFRMCL